MHYISNACAYKLLGVYHIHRDPQDVMNKPRKFVGIGYRIRGNSTLCREWQHAVPAGWGSFSKQTRYA